MKNVAKYNYHDAVEYNSPANCVMFITCKKYDKTFQLYHDRILILFHVVQYESSFH